MEEINKEVNVDELVDSTYTEQPPEVSKFHKLVLFS